MTIYELHLAFRDAVDRINSSAIPDFGIEQVDRYLNLGAEKFVRTRYNGNNFKGTRFEEVQQNIDEINFLVTYLTIPKTTVGNYTSGNIKTVYFPIPEDHWYSIAEQCECSVEPCPKNRKKWNCQLKEFELIPQENISVNYPVYARRHNEINTLLEDPFNKPNKSYMWRVMNDYKIQLFYDSSYLTPLNYKLAYIRQFERIEEGLNYIMVDVDDGDPNNWFNKEYWFPKSTHQMIADNGAKAALEAVEQTTRLQSFTKEVLERE